MAQEQQGQQDREDLSEEASPYRLEEYRQKGQVAQSKELSGLIALVGAGTTLYLMSPSIGRDISQYMRGIFHIEDIIKLDLLNWEILGGILTNFLGITLKIVAPIALVAFIIGIAGSYAQIGSIFSMDPIQPNWSRVNPVSGFMRYFSLKHLYDGLRLTLKTTIVVLISYMLLKSELLQAPAFNLMEPAGILGGYNRSGKVIFFTLVSVLLIFAGFDFWIQRWEFSKSVRLTKQEQKQEQKEREGDPLIKARIRSVQRELARRRMMEAVKKADVVITNPTHIAVALIYQTDKMHAPKVVAKGADFLAQKIKKIAAEAGIPMVENVPLARTLFKSVKVGKFVPRTLYQAVAEVLAYVYKLKGRRS